MLYNLRRNVSLQISIVAVTELVQFIIKQIRKRIK